MALLNASNLAQSFGEFDLFHGISVTIPNGGKIGMVGPNGIGKTTLLLLLAGIAKPSAGDLHLAKGTQIGYLPQEAEQAFVGKSHSIYAEMETAFTSLHEMQAQLRQLEADIAAGNNESYEQYGMLLEIFERRGGYETEIRIKQTLTGLGFPPESWKMPLSQLSGGQKTRALLARLLLEQPDLLILDEPTNHLDVTAVEWLEGILGKWDGAVLVVSHDRFFLNQVVDTIWEMGRNYIELYRGNYDAYTRQRDERWERRENEFITLKSRMEKELDFIRRHMAGRGTRQAQGKLSRLSRELQAFEQGGISALQGKSWAEAASEFEISRHALSVDEATSRVRALKNPVQRLSGLKLDFPAPQRSGHIILKSQGLTVGYPGSPLFVADEIELFRQERAALIGSNGSGKSTFLKTITADLAPLAGEITLGASLTLGYFSQAREELNDSLSLFDNLQQHHPMPISEARNYLARFLFRGDNIFDPVATLSGGERSRLALAILLLKEANLLILDEPTNHLDILSQEALEAALLAFSGTIIMVSHDRYLVNRIATQIWHLHDGRLHSFNGSYKEYRASLQPETAVEKQKSTSATAVPAAGKSLSKNALKKRAQQIEAAEQQIEAAEKQLEQLTTALEEATKEQSFDKIQGISLEYTATEQLLDSLLAEWEKLACE